MERIENQVERRQPWWAKVQSLGFLPRHGTDTSSSTGDKRGMRTVRVRKGETLYMLAQQHKVSLLELQRLNRIDDVNLVYEGRELVLPTGWAGATISKRVRQSRAHQGMYVVDTGDSLWDVAMATGLRVDEVRLLNQHVTADTLTAGQTLYLGRKPGPTGMHGALQDAENALDMCASLAVRGWRPPSAFHTSHQHAGRAPAASWLRNITNSAAAPEVRAAPDSAAPAAAPIAAARVKRSVSPSATQSHPAAAAAPALLPAIDVTGPSLATFVKAARTGLELLKRPQATTEAPAMSTADRPDLRAVLNDTGKAFLSWCDDKGLLHTLPDGSLGVGRAEHDDGLKMRMRRRRRSARDGGNVYHDATAATPPAAVAQTTISAHGWVQRASAADEEGRVETLDWQQADGEWLLVPCLGSSPNKIPSLFNRAAHAFPSVANPGDTLALIGSALDGQKGLLAPTAATMLNVMLEFVTNTAVVDMLPGGAQAGQSGRGFASPTSTPLGVHPDTVRETGASMAANVLFLTPEEAGRVEPNPNNTRKGMEDSALELLMGKAGSKALKQLQEESERNSLAASAVPQVLSAPEAFNLRPASTQVVMPPTMSAQTKRVAASATSALATAPAAAALLGAPPSTSPPPVEAAVIETPRSQATEPRAAASAVLSPRLMGGSVEHHTHAPGPSPSVKSARSGRTYLDTGSVAARHAQPRMCGARAVSVGLSETDVDLLSDDEWAWGSNGIDTTRSRVRMSRRGPRHWASALAHTGNSRHATPVSPPKANEKVLNALKVGECDEVKRQLEQELEQKPSPPPSSVDSSTVGDAHGGLASAAPTELASVAGWDEQKRTTTHTVCGDRVNPESTKSPLPTPRALALAERNAVARDEFYRLLAEEAAQYLTPRTHGAHLVAASVAAAPERLAAAPASPADYEPAPSSAPSEVADSERPTAAASIPSRSISHDGSFTEVMAHPLSARSSPQSTPSPREQASPEGRSLTSVSHRKPNARAHAEGAVAALHLDSAAMHQPAATAAAAAATPPPLPPLTAAHVLGQVHNQTMRHATIDRETSFVDGVPFAKHLSVDGSVASERREASVSSACQQPPGGRFGFGWGAKWVSGRAWLRSAAQAPSMPVNALYDTAPSPSPTNSQQSRVRSRTELDTMDAYRITSPASAMAAAVILPPRVERRRGVRELRELASAVAVAAAAEAPTAQSGRSTWTRLAQRWFAPCTRPRVSD